MATDPIVKPTFEAALPEIMRIVASRRGSWAYISIMPWEDVSQHLLMRAFQKWPLYDPAKGPLENWLNTLISRELINLRRDLYLRTAKPCVGGFTGRANGKHCEYNLGGDACAFTRSKVQCAECPVYAKWQRERESQHHVKAQVSLENHTQEAHNMPDDSIDVMAIKEWLHKAMLAELTRWEGRVYRLSIVQELPPAQVVEILEKEVAKRKRPLAAQEGYTYGHILQYNRTFRGMMRVLLLREGHIGPEHMDPNRNRRRAAPSTHGL